MLDFGLNCSKSKICEANKNNQAFKIQNQASNIKHPKSKIKDSAAQHHNFPALHPSFAQDADGVKARRQILHFHLMLAGTN